MNFSDYIKKGEKKAGSQVELAKILGQVDSSVRAALAGKRGLPTAICIKLADYIDEDRVSVIASSDLVTEKREDRKEILRKCIKNIEKATAMGLIIATTTILTPSPAEARSMENTDPNRMYIMLN